MGCWKDFQHLNNVRQLIVIINCLKGASREKFKYKSQHKETINVWDNTYVSYFDLICIHCKNIILGLKMAQQLRALATLMDDWAWFSAPTWRLTTTSYSSFRKSFIVLWLRWPQTWMWSTETHVDKALKHIKKNRR